MSIQVIIALAIAIPIILFPAAFVWYLNIGGVFASVKEARAARKAQKLAVKDK
ncbi:MAG: hypothetical protein Q7T57_04420 [Dehalococcoidales bacterium]|nr:hypothetical protein [Dehalococcoidales bacterium]